MEAKYICGYQGAKDKIYDNQEEATASLQVLALEDQLKAEQIAFDSFIKTAEDELAGMLVGDRYRVSARDLTQEHRMMIRCILHSAPKFISFCKIASSMKTQLDSTRNEMHSLRVKLARPHVEFAKPYYEKDTVFKRLRKALGL